MGYIEGMFRKFIKIRAHDSEHCDRVEFCFFGSLKEERENLKKLVIEGFSQKLNFALALLEPIDKYLVIFKADGVPLSDVYDCMNVKLPQYFKDMKLSRDELTYVLNCCNLRFELIYGVSHEIAFLLDPRFIGEGMTPTIKKKTENFIIEFPVDDINPPTDERKEKLYQQLIDFQVDAVGDKRAKSPFRYNMLVTRKTTVLKYWITTGQRWPELQQLAVRIFQLSPSSTASERNFSTFGFIHSKGRNRLGPDRVDKLVFIKFNHGQYVPIDQNELD